VLPDISRTRPTPADREAAILVQDHASAVLQRDELTYREALRTRCVDALRPEIADGAQAYDATWPDRGKIRVVVDGVRVRAPATLPRRWVVGYQGLQARFWMVE
jgi:hypothetical protein